MTRAVMMMVAGVLMSGVMPGQRVAGGSTETTRIHGLVKGSDTVLEQLGLLQDRVDNATVRLKTVPGGRIVSVTNTSQEGFFEVVAPRPGAYLLTIDAPKFATMRLRITAMGGDLALTNTILQVDVPCPKTFATSPQAMDQPIAISLCELTKDPDRFSGKLVRFRAKVDFGFEASVLSDGTRTIWLSAGLPVTMTVPGGFKPPNPRIVLEKNVDYEKMIHYLSARYGKEGSVCEDCALYEVSVDAVGLFEHVDKLTTPLGQRLLAGFGHMNGYESQLVLQSVSNVVATPIDTSIYDKRR